MFSNKISIFIYKKVKVKKLLFDFFSFFAFLSLFFNVLLPSLAMSTVKQLLGDLHLFWEDFLFRFLRENTLQCLKKIQVQIIVFNKKAVAKMSRISNSKNPPWSLECQVFLGRHLKNSVLNFLVLIVN